MKAPLKIHQDLCDFVAVTVTDAARRDKRDES